jgi:hypothetical protein
MSFHSCKISGKEKGEEIHLSFLLFNLMVSVLNWLLCDDEKL